MRKLIAASMFLGFLVSGTSLPAQQNFDNVQIQTVPVAGGIYMLMGAGGNIGVCAGEDGIFLVDDQYAPLTEKIKKAVAAIRPEPIKFLLNTHWHGDHTGGNENLGRAGVLIVAHDNVRKRMSVEQFIEAFNMKSPPSPEVALPVVTFNDTVTFHLNGEQIHAFHVPPAHTDGDSVIHFRSANVVHMGDLFFNGLYPFIDVGSGGSVDGMIAAADRVLGMINDQTKVIPGHGPLADKKALRQFRDMLASIKDRVQPLISSGKSLDEVIKAQPTKEFDAQWGGGFLNPEAFVRIVYSSLKKP